jgi:hypothetical protein
MLRREIGVDVSGRRAGAQPAEEAVLPREQNSATGISACGDAWRVRGASRRSTTLMADPPHRF